MLVHLYYIFVWFCSRIYFCMLLNAIHFLAFVPDMPLIVLLPALHFNLVSLFMLKCLFSTKFLLLLSARIAKWGIIFFEWCILPMIDHSCFSALGFSCWSNASLLELFLLNWFCILTILIL